MNDFAYLANKFHEEKNDYINSTTVQNITPNKSTTIFNNYKILSLCIISFFCISSMLFTYFILDRRYLTEDDENIKPRVFMKICLYVTLIHFLYLFLFFQIFRLYSSSE